MSTNLKEALNNGINGEAVGATLNDIVNKSSELGKMPKQAKNVVETIIYMKKNVNSIPDKKYASNLVMDNSERIKSALNEGISPNEIAVTLMETLEKANTRRTKSRLRFMTKLIKKMKQKELALKKQNENSMQHGIQKVLMK